jgi:hypothetical protein
VADHAALMGRYIEIHNTNAWDRLGEVLTEDYVEEYPQSGEVFRGLARARAVRANYPGNQSLVDNIDRSTISLAATEEEWVMTPMFTAVRVEGSGNVGTAVLRITYPDGSRWWNVILYEIRGNKIALARDFFAAEFDAPDWRAPFRDPSPSANAVARGMS